MQMLPAAEKIVMQELKGRLFREKKVQVSVARLDLIHPVVSGNKLFKLHYFLKQAMDHPGKTMLTFGGAYSNHLVATAYACRFYGLPCIGVVRGERPAQLSHTLLQCEAYGMQLQFISRADYQNKVYSHDEDHLVVPEGGYHPLGAKGAALIMEKLALHKATHICTAFGTATTLAGLLQHTPNNETIIGIPVLKDMQDIDQRLNHLLETNDHKTPVILDNYHFGGYAKKTASLIYFMNELFNQEQLPTDFVYTAKMMYAVVDKINTGYFKEGSNIICIHTGGLQGNDSLGKNVLVF